MFINGMIHCKPKLASIESSRVPKMGINAPAATSLK